MKYTFVDIGCGAAGVSTDIYGLDVRGLLVEPIPECCKCLPNSNTVLIECSAIGSKNTKLNITTPIKQGEVLEYLPSNIQDDEKKLQRYFKTKNITKYSGKGLPFGLSSFLSKQELPWDCELYERSVNMITLKDLFVKYNVSEIEQLKIDVEGHESIILNQLITLMRNNQIIITDKLIFEYNFLSNLSELDKLKDIIANEFGFTYEYIEFGTNQDIIMEKIK